jgi:hypothetical protein
VQVQIITILKLNEVLLDEHVHPVLVLQDHLPNDAFFALGRNACALLSNLRDDEGRERRGSEGE